MTPSQFGTAKWRYGVLMACSTSFLWGILPILLKLGLKDFSVETVAWFRFAFAFLVLGIWLRLKNKEDFKLRPPFLGILGGIFLAGNYYFMTEGIHLSGPANAAILIQLAPLLLVLIGVFAFGESLAVRQILGLMMAGIGFFLFYRDNLQSSLDASAYAWAGFNVVLAAIAWVAFMVCQKVLSPSYSPQVKNFFVYGIAGLTLLPFVEWAQFTELDVGSAVLLISLGLNTVLAYGALAEAVHCISLTLISVITALNPLITLLGMKLFAYYFPGKLNPVNHSAIGYLGAFMAVAGVVAVVMQKTKNNREAPL